MGEGGRIGGSLGQGITLGTSLTVLKPTINSMRERGFGQLSLPAFAQVDFLQAPLTTVRTDNGFFEAGA